MRKYIAMVETVSNGCRIDYAVTGRQSLTSSPCWTAARLYLTHDSAEQAAKQAAAGFDASENARAYVRTVNI